MRTEYTEIIQLSDPELAQFMSEKKDALRRIIETRGVSMIENKHLIVIDERTSEKDAHRKPIALYTVRRGEFTEVRGRKIWGVSTHHNAGQSFILDDVLGDSDVKLLAVTGHAGTGKTFISLLAALNRPDTQRIIFTREVQECGKSLGFLPGNIDDKFSPYMRPLWDNIEELEFYSGKVSSERILPIPMQFLRGSTVRDTLIIVDEAQNCKVDQLKMVISRCGSGSMVILLGSFNQIDTHGNDKDNNGLAKVIRGFRGQACFSHVHLVNDERSELARLADELL